MWWFDPLVMLAQSRRLPGPDEDDNGGGMMRLLPLVVIFLLYVINALFKAYQEKQAQKNKPKLRTETPSPPQAQPPARPPTPPRAQRPVPPRPTAAIPRPVGPPPPPRPARYAPPLPAEMRRAVPPASRRGEAAAPAILIVEERRGQTEATPTPPVREAAALARPGVPLSRALRQPRQLARAFVLAEIVGQPVGLRRAEDRPGGLF
jgi:hypothetical protein